ncbi:MAG: hypothetical protein HRU09_08320 [Oligoflexales bacterium]|nr:hypothetical protein [Oligoflexales bacterium]
MQGFVLGLLIASASLKAFPAFGISLLDTIRSNPFTKQDSLRVFTHPNNSSPDNELSLYQGLYLQNGPSQNIINYLHSTGLDLGFKINLGKKWRSPHDGHQIYHYTFSSGNIAVCEHQVKAHIHAGHLPTITGSLPLSKPERERYPESLWLPVSELLAITKSSTNVFITPELLKLNHASKCLYSYGGELIPVWKMLVSHMGLNYAIFRDAHEVYKLEKRFYQVSGTTQSYQINPVDPSGLVEESFEFVGDTFLTSDRLTTKPNGIERISSDQHDFRLSPDHENFPEVNVFSQVSRMIAWFEEKSFKWVEGEVLTVKIHESIATESGLNPNNALYLPAEYDAPDVPSITLGDGDGVHLTNLALDADVSGHELGHHVIFQSVKSTQQLEERDGSEELTDHSGAIHEGLADFFMFAKSGNSCLGESICPGSGAICSQQGECLRNADNDLKYASDEYWNIDNRLYHLKGQLISGLLWDIRTDGNVSETDFDSLVVRAIQFLDARSTYNNLLLALVASDHHFYQGKYCDTITNKAKERGFETQVDEIIPDCLNFVPEGDYEFVVDEGSGDDGSILNDEPQIPAIIEIKRTEKREKAKASDLCGTIGSSSDHTSSKIPNLFLIFLFTIPLIIAQSFQRMFRN